MTARTPGLSYLAKAAACFLVVLVMIQGATAATVRGQLILYAPNGAQYPAGGFAVTIYNQYTGRSSPAYTGPDGMYYIYYVRAGGYYLEVWKPQNPTPTVYPIQVVDPYTDIPPICACR